MTDRHPFEQFLQTYIPRVSAKSKQANLAHWLLETTGNQDAAALTEDLDIELKMLFNDKETYEKLIQWQRDLPPEDPFLKRELNVLIRLFKQNCISPSILAKIAKQEAELLFSYANFRPKIDGLPLSENALREILKNDNDPKRREGAWQASKEIGAILAPNILSLVKLRNEAAASLGYSDYFQMQLDLQEIDSQWLFAILQDLSQRSEKGYLATLDLIQKEQCTRFKVSQEQLGPWAWSEPFGQEDPIGSNGLDALVADVDICEISQKFYKKMGFAIGPIYQKSDLYEREGKNQHAFCTSIDRKEDVRILCNIKNSIKWLETTLHELGHAVYDLGFDQKLPWLLREPPHMIPTEAMALLAGRQAYSSPFLFELLPSSLDKEKLLTAAKQSLTRRQLIFSRWVLVMTYFEKELYANPEQDLNGLWWEYVNKYQKIPIPPHRTGKQDWAAKYHIGLAPVYYFSYLLGEMFASEIQEQITLLTGSEDLASKEAGNFLKTKLFFPGNSMNAMELVEHVTSKPLSCDAWIRQFTESFAREREK